MHNTQLRWRREYPYLVAWERVVPCSCVVRNLENGQRREAEVVFSVPHHKPYSPQEFPDGTWQVGWPRKRETAYLRPFYIPTNAFRVVPVWELEDGKYKRATAVDTLDEAYGLHFSTSSSTLGCIRVHELDDLLWLVEKIKEVYDKEDVFFEVG